MELRFTYQRHFTGIADNTKHFLLKSGTLELTLRFHDNTELVVNVPRQPVVASGFVAKIEPAMIPLLQAPIPGSGLRRKQIVRIRCAYRLLLDHNAKRYDLLNVTQQFTATPGEGHSDTNLVYTLAPSGWNNAIGVYKLGNAATHPLINLDKLASNEIRLNALVVNLTELWAELHKENVFYKVHLAALSNHGKVTFQVLGNLSGNAFIWYASVPNHLQSATRVTPHVFFSPADNASLQQEHDQEKYLLSGDFQGDGRSLFKYLLPPAADLDIPNLPSALPQDTWKGWRNTCGFAFLDSAKTSIGTKHWRIPAGLERAFYADGKTQPKQFLLIPQDNGDEVAGTSNKGIQTLGPAEALRTIAGTAALVLQTQTKLLGYAANDRVEVDKLVVSGYSEGGFDLWIAVRNNMKELKAVIAIEPQNMNKIENDYGVNPPIGKDVLPKLLKLGGCKVFIVGRHHTSKYKPAIPDSTGITFMPADPKTIFQYPPDPASHPFVRYRTERMTDAALDPLIRPEESEVLTALARQHPPVVGMAALQKIFHPWGNVDCSCADKERKCVCTEHGRDSWYSHQYALSGGQIMKLPEGRQIHNKPIEYTTFFQEAVAMIG